MRKKILSGILVISACVFWACKTTDIVIPLEGIAFEKKVEQLQEGNARKLKVNPVPSKAVLGALTFVSRNSDVAEIKDGKVFAKKAGIATIIVTDDSGHMSSCTVEVEAKGLERARKITFDKPSVIVKVTEHTTLSAIIDPLNAVDRNQIEWLHKGNVIASDCDTILLKFADPGETTITARIGSVEAECHVSVIPEDPIPVTNIKLDKEEMVLYLGEQGFLSASVYPEFASDTSVEWTVKDDKILTVDSEGMIKSRKVGMTTVTARSGEKTAVCKVYVAVPLERLGGFYHDRNADTKQEYFTFGVWPQTIKKDTVKVLEEYGNKEISGAEYFLGDDCYWYAKSTADKFEGHKFSNGQVIQEGNTYYFKVEPIRWRKLGSTSILLSEKILDSNVPFYSDNVVRKSKLRDIMPNNYEYSTIRSYLNGIDCSTNEYNANRQEKSWLGKGFLQKAFTKCQQERILEFDVDNSSDSSSDYNSRLGKGSDGIKNTTDKVFLLSLKEVTNPDYGFSEWNSFGKDNSRLRSLTDYALANYAYRDEKNGMGWWWLRSSYESNDSYARVVDTDGYAHFYNGVDNVMGGIVPAIVVK